MLIQNDKRSVIRTPACISKIHSVFISGRKKLLKEGLNNHPIQKKMLIFFFWDANTLKGSRIRRCWCAGNNRCFGRAGKAGKEIAKRISGERSQTKKLVITGLSFFFSEQEAPSYQSATQLSPFFQDLPLITIILVIIINIIRVISVSTFNSSIIKIDVLLVTVTITCSRSFFLQFISTIWKV